MHLRIVEASKKFGRVRALDRVSAEIQPGQVVVILGANGAGKTTLLRALAGVVALDRGDIFYDEQPFRRNCLDLRKRLCFLPDFPFMFGNMKVIQHIGMVMRLYGVEDDPAVQRIITALTDLDLLPLADVYTGALSRGQIYKTALSALFAVDPEIWLLDEPFASGMDPHGIAKFKEHATAAKMRGRTILYSTQLLELAERFSDKICVLQDGQLKAFESMEQLRTRLKESDGVLETLFKQLREGT